MLRDFFSLFLPPVCAVCTTVLNKGETQICTRCLFVLPHTNYHLQADNPMARLFWGRVEVKKAAAFYLFGQESNVQKLIHRFKYKGQKEIGLIVGRQFAHQLNQSGWTKDLDAIVPVPLHPSRLKERGYNQSLYFAEGLSDVLALPVMKDSLKSIRNNNSQTRRARYQRWKNVEFKFTVLSPEPIRRKNILLVDDVVTSGSTLEACAREILKVQGTSVSIATIAYTNLI
jgi:ComF family protein